VSHESALRFASIGVAVQKPPSLQDTENTFSSVSLICTALDPLEDGSLEQATAKADTKHETTRSQERDMVPMD
jgi:hypothetical protein